MTLRDLRKRRVRDARSGRDVAPLSLPSVQGVADLAKRDGSDGLIHIRIIADPHRDCNPRHNPAVDYDPLAARKVLAANLHAAMNVPDRPEISQQELARRASRYSLKPVSQSTVNRLLNAEVSCGVDHLVSLAQALGLEPWHLLVPHMNPADPPVLTAVTRRLEEFQATLKAQSDQIAALKAELRPR